MVLTPEQEWSDAYAAKIALADFQKGENYRNMNHDWRFRNADELYAAWVGTKYWDGTRVPRSSLGIFVAYQQIESLLPGIISELLASYPPFDVDPEPNTSAVEAKQVLGLMLHQLEQMQAEELLRRVLKSAFIYGNGIMELSWENFERQRLEFLVQRTPVHGRFNHPTLGEIKVPIGSKPRAVTKSVTEQVNRPMLAHVPIQDFYIDQNCETPLCQDAGWAAVRKLVRIDDLLKYSKDKNFSIPSREELLELSKGKVSTQGDYSKSASELMRSGTYWPTQEGTADPAGNRVEVIRYTTPHRLVWLVGRKVAVLNKPNPYGFINFFNVCYTDFPNRFYGFGVTDISEGEQRLITSIINARVDELALAIHKPIIKRKGAIFSQSQLRIRPGVNWEVENPKEDIQTFEYGAINQNAYIEVDAAERRLQKYTGITDLAVLGAPSAGGNSANRTATGVGTQASASGKRQQYLVRVVESTLLEPLLGAIHRLNQKFLDPQQVLQILGPDGKLLQLDPMTIKNAECRFRFLASSRMQSRQNMLQAMGPIMQVFLNPAFMQTLAQVNQKKINAEFLGDKLLDALNIRGGDVFQPLSPEDIQRMNQPNPQDLMKLQMQRERMASIHDDHQEGKSADILSDLLMHSAKEATSDEGETVQ